MTTLTVALDGSLTLPPEEVARLGIRPLALVEVDINPAQDALLVRTIDDDDAWLYTPEHLASMEAGLADIHAGRVRMMSEEDLRRLAPCD